MADGPTSTNYQYIPQVAQGNFGATQPPEVPSGIGFAPRGAQTAEAITQALSGLRAGFAQNQMQQYDQVENQYQVARAQWQALQSQLSDPNLPPQTRQYYQKAMENSQLEMEQSYEQLVNLTSGKGGKGGKKAAGANASGNAQTKEGAAGKIGDFLKKLLLPHTSSPTAPVAGPPPGIPSAPVTTPPFTGDQSGISPNAG